LIGAFDKATKPGEGYHLSDQGVQELVYLFEREIIKKMGSKID
jgi:hypothetical protein